MGDRWLVLPSPFLGPTAYGRLAERLAATGDWAGVAHLPPAPFMPADVLATFTVQALAERATVLVPHSNAGLYTPAVHAATASVVAAVYLDAALPTPGETRAPLAPPAMAHSVAAMADAGGLLPPWTRWWEEADIGPLFPSRQWRAAVDEGAPRVPASYLTSTLPVADGWTDRPSGYLAFGATYAAELALVAGLGWPTTVLVGHHLTLLTDPRAVATATVGLRRACAG